jgi:hypothetical protein
MIFVLINLKYSAMKKLFLIITTMVIISSCSSTKEARSSKIESQNDKKLAKQELVKDAIESRRFIVKLNRLFLTYGGTVQLVPRANYIIVDREKGIISTAYFGRQYAIKPIAAINMFGKTMDYEMTNNTAKGSYKIRLKVADGGTSFDVFLDISKSGSCSASISSLLITNLSYSGQVVPITKRASPSFQNKDVI